MNEKCKNDQVASEMADMLYRVSADDLHNCFEEYKMCRQQCLDGGGGMLKGIEINL
jgi:hypothetical protein